MSFAKQLRGVSPAGHSGASSLRSQARYGERVLPLGDIAAFAIPVTMFVRVQAVGELFLTELLLVGVLYCMMLTRSAAPLGQRVPRTVLLLGLAWMMAQILTDLIRLTPYEDYSRGWAKIGFTITNFAALYLLLDRRRRIILFAAGLALGLSLKAVFDPRELAAVDAWKFAFAMPVVLGVTLIMSSAIFRSAEWLPVFVLAAMSVLNLQMGFRSMAVILCLVTAYCGLRTILAASSWQRTIRLAHVVVAGTVLLIASAGFVFAYSVFVERGVLGEDAREKYELQSQGKWGFVIGGRAEILASVRAIADSPLIGHGSWAKDFEYVGFLYDQLERYGYRVPSSVRSDLIPSHSHVFGSWVEAGIAGALFWVYIAWIIMRSLIRLLASNDNLTPLLAFLSFYMLWSIAFSPYAYDQRVLASYSAVCLAFVWRHHKGMSGAGQDKQGRMWVSVTGNQAMRKC